MQTLLATGGVQIAIHRIPKKWEVMVTLRNRQEREHTKKFFED